MKHLWVTFSKLLKFVSQTDKKLHDAWTFFFVFHARKSHTSSQSKANVSENRDAFEVLFGTYLTHTSALFLSSPQMGNVSETALFASTISRQHDVLMATFYTVFCESTTTIAFWHPLHLHMWFNQSRTANYASMTLHILFLMNNWNGSAVINLLLSLIPCLCPPRPNCHEDDQIYIL